MKNNKSSESRRILLKSIAAGSGAIVVGKSLPESWSRPVVDSVMLPAHAQTSPVVTGTAPIPQNQVYSDTYFINNASLDSESNSMLVDAMDLLAPTANAQGVVETFASIDACATPNGENVDVWIQAIWFLGGTTIPNTTEWWKGLLALDGTDGSLTVTDQCSEIADSNLDAKVASYNDIEIEILVQGKMHTLPFVPFCVPFSTIQCLNN